jgi:EAL domain-containing protein (putative c-di-GMP-specific phosphodiesterase class I)
VPWRAPQAENRPIYRRSAARAWVRGSGRRPPRPAAAATTDATQTVGYEALTRFDDGASPEDRFSLADQVGLGRELERVTLGAALEAQRHLPPGPWLGINASPALLLEPDLLRTLREGTLGRPVILEVTEHVAVENYDELREALGRFDGSVRLAVDDAGAGFASLQHIIELHPEIVKLHSGLVRNIQRDPVRQALVAGMRYFAESTGCALLAEGVEQSAEARTLRRLGVELGQGYLFGRPVPVDARPPRLSAVG